MFHATTAQGEEALFRGAVHAADDYLVHHGVLHGVPDVREHLPGDLGELGEVRVDDRLVALAAPFSALSVVGLRGLDLAQDVIAHLQGVQNGTS